MSIDGEAWRVLAPQKYELFPFRKHFEENPRKTNKKSRRIISDSFDSSVPFRSVVHESNLTHQPSVHRLVGGSVVEQVAQHVAAGLLLHALPTENILTTA